jgi:hypothetical protein
VKTLIIILFFWQSNLSAQCANQSNIYSFIYDGRTYEVVKELKSWSTAVACALERGGSLVEINDVNEQTAVYNGILAAGISSTYTSVADGGGAAYVWMGATDKITEGEWLWDGNNDGVGVNFWNGQGQAGTGGGLPSSSSYNNWGKTGGTGTIMEPDDYISNQDAGAIALAGWPASTTFLGIAGQWNDINFNNTLYYVIENTTNLSLNEINNQNNTSAFPNPCTDNLNIQANRNLEDICYQIYDLTGKLIRDDKFKTDNLINTILLNKGIYYIHFIDKISPVIIKFIKE